MCLQLRLDFVFLNYHSRNPIWTKWVQSAPNAPTTTALVTRRNKLRPCNSSSLLFCDEVSWSFGHFGQRKRRSRMGCARGLEWLYIHTDIFQCRSKSKPWADSGWIVGSGHVENGLYTHSLPTEQPHICVFCSHCRIIEIFFSLWFYSAPYAGI